VNAGRPLRKGGRRSAVRAGAKIDPVTRRASKSSPWTDRRATPTESESTQTSKKAARPSADVEHAAHAAIAHEALATPSGDKLKGYQPSVMA
jgi:hypothetical protein